MDEWQLKTKLKLEKAVYDRMIIRDVNKSMAFSGVPFLNDVLSFFISAYTLTKASPNCSGYNPFAIARLG
jgi:hypothetical protein